VSARRDGAHSPASLVAPSSTILPDQGNNGARPPLGAGPAGS
jgi:hypothetical protein